MPSDSKKKREAKKKEQAKARDVTKKETPKDSTNGVKNCGKGDAEDELVAKMERDLDINAEFRSCTGVLGVHPRSRDIKIDNFSLTFHGCEMLTDTKLGWFLFSGLFYK